MQTMAKHYKLGIWQDGIEVAGVSGPDFEKVYREAMPYQMLYSQDGPIEMRGVPRKKMDWVKAQLDGESK
jgi:hypothetical protein